MEKTFFSYIFRYSWRHQAALLALTVASFPFLYAILDLPKTIVNGAIGGRDFPKLVFGFQFDQLEYLALLCAVFLTLVGVNGAFKYVINVYKGVVGERMLRRLRYQLYQHVLRFPIPLFARTSQGEIISMITAEVEPLGGFIGDAVALPAFQGGTLLTILVFMFVQDWQLGLAAVVLYPLQAYLIPKLQRQVNELAKERVKTVRKLSERIGDSINSITEIHANDTSEWHRAEFAGWIGRIFDIRLRIYRKKFFIKFLNNFIAQVTPFFFYSIGGYLVITGQLSFGALVAVLAAYKDLASPWKELLDWYQQKEDTRVKYDQLVEQFVQPGLLPEDLQVAPTSPPETLRGAITVSNVAVQDDAGISLLDGVSFSADVGEKIALVGSSGSGAGVLAQLLALLVRPTSGALTIGGAVAQTIPEWVGGRRIAYVGPETALVNGTIRDNLIYPLKRRPERPPEDQDEEQQERRRRWREEALRSGNTDSDLDADWIDYAAAGASGPVELSSRIVEALRIVDLEEDMIAFGLRRTIDIEARSDLVQPVLDARRRLAARLAEPEFRGLIERFDPERFNQNMSVAENILFGMPVGATFDLERIAENSYMRSVLQEVGLTDEFVARGENIARFMVELVSVAAGREFDELSTFVPPDQLPDLQATLRRVELKEATEADRLALMSLPFKAVAARHRFRGLNVEMQQRLLEARRVFATNLPPSFRSAIAFFDPDAYNPEASLQDNILFGKIVYGKGQAQRRIGALLADVIERLGLRDVIVELGLEYEVGINGSRLAAGQRQRIGFARAVLKRPDLVVLNQAFTALEPGSKATLLHRLVAAAPTAGLVTVEGPADDVTMYDRVIVMEGGRIAQINSAQRPVASATTFSPGRTTEG